MKTSEKLRAVVSAGRVNKGYLEACDPAEWEAMIPIGDRPMAAWVAEALCEAGMAEVLVIGPEELRPHLPPTCVLLPPGETLWDNLRSAAAYGGHNWDRMLFATGDIPLLTPGGVKDFLERCGATPGDIYYSIITKQNTEKAYPATMRTYVRLTDGSFTGGNLFLFSRDGLPVVITWGEQAYAARKDPWKLVMLLGFSFAIRFALGMLSIGAIEAKAKGLMGLTGKAVITPYAEIGMDADRPEDLELIRAKVAGGGKALG